MMSIRVFLRTEWGINNIFLFVFLFSFVCLFVCLFVVFFTLWCSFLVVVKISVCCKLLFVCLFFLVFTDLNPDNRNTVSVFGCGH